MGKVVLFSIAGCRHCRAAKALLTKKGVEYHEINLSDYPKRRKELAEKANGAKTVPQIFLNGSHIGGNGELQALEADHKLDALLKACADEEDAPERPLTTEEYVEAFGESKVEIAERKIDETEAAIERLAAEMRSGIELATRRYYLTTYKKCFLGRQAVDWMVKNKSMSRAAAVAELCTIAKRGIIHHVTHAHPFKDSDLFYRFSDDEETNVLNVSRIFDQPARPASAVAEAIRQQILRIYNTYLNESGTGVNYNGIAESQEFMEYTRQATELQKVDLAGLTVDETLAFFINIYNALVIHGHVKLGRPSSTLGRLRFFGNVAYNIGGHNYALSDIEQGILRGNRTGPGELRPRFGSKDPRGKYALPVVEPRIHFALVCGAKSCPPIKLYKPETVQEELDLAAEAFLEDSSNFHIDESRRTVTVSQIFKWYKKDFGATAVDACHWAMKYLPPAKKAAMARLLHIVEEAGPAGYCTGGSVSLKYFTYDWGQNDGTAGSDKSAGAGTGAGAGHGK